MEITLSDKAIAWFEEDFPLHEGEAIRFFGKTYGKTNVHDGFSIGIQLDKLENHEKILGSTEINGRTYFTTHQDDWFFNEYDLKVNIDDNFNEPSYEFH